MKTTSANYDTQNALAVKNFVGLIDFGITRRYCSETFGNINTTNDKKYIRNISYQVPTIDLLSRPVMGNFTANFEIVDKDLDVTGILNANSMVNADVDISFGFQELDDTDFVDLTTHQVRKVQLTSSNLSYMFLSEDVKRKFDKKIFRNITRTDLNGAHTDSDTTIDVTDASVFLDPASLSSPNIFDRMIVSAYVRVGGEEMTHSSTSSNTLTVSRGQNGTTAVAHDDGVDIVQFVDITTFNWSDILLSILLTTDDASGGYYDLGNHDTWFYGFGLGFDDTEIDIRGIEKLGAELPTGHIDHLTILVEREENALNWIDKYLLKPLGLFMYINGSGKITVDSFDFIHMTEAFSADATLNNDDILDGSTFEQIDDKLINEIQVNNGIWWRDTDVTSSPNDQVTIQLDESITDYGITKRYTVEMPTSVPNTAVDEWDELRATKWLYTFGNVWGIVRLNINYENWLIEQGDYITITWDKFPELTDGTRGWTTKKALVLGQTANFDFVEPKNSTYTLTCFTWELYNRVTSFITTTDTIAQGSITRTTLSYNSDNTTTLDAEDAYHDFASTETPDVIKLTVTLTWPNSGSTEHDCTLNAKGMEDTGGGVYATRGNKTFYIRYNSSETGTDDYVITFSAYDATNNNIDRIKVDFFNKSASGAEIPTFTFKEIKLISLNETMTIV